MPQEACSGVELFAVNLFCYKFLIHMKGFYVALKTIQQSEYISAVKLFDFSI